MSHGIPAGEGLPELEAIKSLLVGIWCNGAGTTYEVQFIRDRRVGGSWWARRWRNERALKSCTFRWCFATRRILWNDLYELKPEELGMMPDCATWHAVADGNAETGTSQRVLWRRFNNGQCACCYEGGI